VSEHNGHGPNDRNDDDTNREVNDRFEKITAGLGDLAANTGTDGDELDRDVDGRLVDAEGRPVPVNPPPESAGDVLAVERSTATRLHPVLPGWLRSGREFARQFGWAIKLAGHRTAFHGVRLPVYGLRLALYSPRGAGRIVAGAWRWATDAEGAPVRTAAVDRADAKEYLSLSRQRNDRVRWRTIQLLAAAVAVTVAILVGLAMFPTWGDWLMAATAVLAVGAVGQRRDRPVVGRAVDSPKVPRLTDTVVIRALGSLGIAGINQALAAEGEKAIGIPSPITRDGLGWRAEVDLPFGVTVGDIMDRREKLASGLRRPLGCVWPEPSPDAHAGRLVLWVGDTDMAKAKPAAGPLAKTGRVDLFRAFPFGTDPRGRLVSVTLMFAAVVIGSIPRMGKTFALRLLLLAAALDPRAELHIYDLKGTGDLSPLEPVCHRYRAGDDDEDIAYALADVKALHSEMRRRTKVIRGLPRDKCAENKVTPELASIKSLGLHPVVLAVDECQRWFEHPDHGSEFEVICEDLVRRGPAVGIVTVFATQRPDAKSLPTGISGNAVLRFCLKVMGHTENDMVLGTSAHKNGVRATLFRRSDKGIGYLSGEGDDPQITRTYYIDGPKAEAIVARARALRAKAGTLSGHALGEAPEVESGPGYDLLADVLAVVGPDEAKVWNEQVVARLAELRPAVYAGWRPEQLTTALKPHGVATGQVWGTDPATGRGGNRRGITRDHLIAAVTQRDKP
jgi:S-DNA-T family DNA segregation ATPase FtsK/SpoIIIE